MKYGVPNEANTDGFNGEDQTSVENPTLEKLAALAARVEELEKKLHEKET